MSSKGKTEGRRRRGHARGWDGGMASPMQWTWTWANFGRWWGTGRPAVLQSMGLRRLWHDWVTEQQQRGKRMVKNSQRVLVPSEFIAGLRIWDHFSQMCVILLQLCKQRLLVWLHNHENYGSLLSTLSVTGLTLLLCLVPGWEKVTSGIYCSRLFHVLLGCQLMVRRPAHVPTCRALPSDLLV